MVTAAIAPFPQFTLLDYELQKTTSCYTIETIRTLAEEDSKVDYFLLLGEDAAHSLPTWKEVDALIKLAPPLVGSREKNWTSEVQGASPSLAKLLKKGWTVIPRLEISSTWVRSRVQKGEYAGHLVPGKVWDYIQAHQLYASQK
jgi:nicotinate-nucleotide adenylyltransferase